MKNLAKWLLFALFVLWVLYAIFSNASATGQQNNAKFDHNRCQYPERDTNPPNGCDNSDPACPETMKLGYDCQPKGNTEVQAEIPTSQNIEVAEMVGK